MDESSENKCVPLQLIDIPFGNKTFTLIQDGNLPAGTKQRGVKFFYDLKRNGVTEVVTHGTVYGYGQVATAWCCKQAGLRCTIFLARTYPRTFMTQEAIKFGAYVVDIGSSNGHASNKILSTKAKTYASENPSRKLIKIGLDEPDFIQALADGIMSCKGNIDPKRIWVAGGSGVLSRALAKAFPEVELCIVQVGRKIYPDILDGIKYNLYSSPEHFKSDAEILPPYESLKHYDAKVWRFAREYGEDGDYIWNVK
jgi:hypothetical protein